MAKAKASKKQAKTKSILNEASWAFLKEYINTPSAVGFETGGQKVWLKYVKQYSDTQFTDPYGTAVGVINPTAEFLHVTLKLCRNYADYA